MQTKGEIKRAYDCSYWYESEEQSTCCPNAQEVVLELGITQNA